MECIFCNSNEITYNSLICDSYCANCGQWQEEVGRLITK